MLNHLRQLYKTENAVKNRIVWCEARPKHHDDISLLYMLLGEIRVKNRHTSNRKAAELNRREKINRKYNATLKNVLYERNIRDYVNEHEIDICPCDKERKLRYMRFFFPYKRCTPKGHLKPIIGFSEDVAMLFIDNIIKVEMTKGIDLYDDVKKTYTGKEFIKLYENGVDSYHQLFPKFPLELLSKLYNIRQSGHTAIGNGEYLLMMKISDMNGLNDGDICTDSGVNLEAKAFGGRLDCQKDSDVNAMDDFFSKDLSFSEYKVTCDGMINSYKHLRALGYSDKDIIEIFAKCKIQTYQKFLTQDQKDLFIKNMTENWDKFIFNGDGFTKESIYMINGCHDAFVYPLLEKFTHLKVDTKQPKDRKDFNVRFKIFTRNDFCAPATILKMIENNLIRFDGLIKNNGRDKSSHVYIN